MSCHPNIAALVSYGLEGQQSLADAISTVLGEPMEQTTATYDTLDFQSKTLFAELKRRKPEWSYYDEKIKKEGWLIPSCKILRAWEELDKGKRVFFFYFWSSDKTLWVFEMMPGDFSSTPHFIPKNHYDQMLHVAVPQERWRRCEVDLTHLQFEEDQCQIQD